jgi:hypothetical protein
MNRVSGTRPSLSVAGPVRACSVLPVHGHSLPSDKPVIPTFYYLLLPSSCLLPLTSPSSTSRGLGGEALRLAWFIEGAFHE